jgi:hypothetical protein
MQTVSEATNTTELAAAERMVTAVAELRILVHRFHGEGLDRDFLFALDDQLMQWEPTAQGEWREAAIEAFQKRVAALQS